MSDWTAQRSKLRAEQEKSQPSRKKGESLDKEVSNTASNSSGGYARPISTPGNFSNVSQAEKLAQIRSKAAKEAEEEKAKKLLEERAKEDEEKEAKDESANRVAQSASGTPERVSAADDMPVTRNSIPQGFGEENEPKSDAGGATEASSSKEPSQNAEQQGYGEGEGQQGSSEAGGAPGQADKTEKWQNLNPFCRKALNVGGALSRIATDAIREALVRSKEYVGKAGAYVCAQVVDQINSQADFLKSLWIRPVARSTNPSDHEAVVVLAVTCPQQDMQEKMILAVQAVIVNPLVDKKLVSEFKLSSTPPSGFEALEGTLLILQLAVPVTPNWCPITYTDLKAWKAALGKTVELQVVLPPSAEGDSGGAAKVHEDDGPPEPLKRGDIKWKDVLWPF